MKKLKLLLLGLLLGAGVLWLLPAKASAACGITTEMGRATYTVNVAQAGTYKLWFRIKPQSSANNAAYVQVDNGTCFKIGDNSALPAGSWTWVNYSQNGTTQTPMTYNFTKGNHTLVIIGFESGVQVDRNILLLTSDGCTPSNARSTGSEPGDNCLVNSNPTNPTQNQTGNNNSGGTVVASTKTGAPIRAVTSNSTVSGDVVLDSSIVNDPTVEKVEYYVDSKLIYTSNEMPFYLDTSVLQDGTYNITEKVYYKDGRIEEHTSQLTINNNGQAATAATKKKSHKLLIFGGVLVVLIGGLAALVFFNPTVKAFVAAKLSRITGRAIRF